MRLSEFILANIERILQRWEDFARSLPSGRDMSIAALRNDAERMLRFLAADMDTDQSAQQQFDKSTGHGPALPGGQQSAAHDHGLARAVDHFTMAEMVSEHRALRASVTELWLSDNPKLYENAIQLVRFNEGIDQILAESVVRFSKKVDEDAHLFTGSIGHDLRNPLNAVVMSAELLSKGTASADQQRSAVGQIKQSALRIDRMLRELNDFTRARLASLTGYQRRQLDVANICRQVIDELTAANPKRELRFTFMGDTVATVDENRIAQMVSNLVANAVDHGCDQTEVLVRAIGEAEVVTIEVHNEGPAIPPAELDRIFEPLYRADQRRSHDREHLGLGLYIARTIALAHGASIGVVSTDTEGTTFSVRIPRVQ